MLSTLTRSLPLPTQRTLAGFNLPTHYRKLVATQLTTDFRESAKIVEVPTPKLKAGEALFRIIYAAINASDILKANGYYGDTEADVPFDLGLEGLGQVVAVGPGVPSAVLGKYMSLSDTGVTAGCFGEYRVMNLLKSYAAPVPKPKPEFAAMMVTGVSVAVAMHACAKLGSDETVLITAAAGSGGSYAVQLAKQAGNTVIATCGSADKVRLLYELGCDRVINYRQEDVGEVLAREYPDGINLIFDSVGGELFDTLLDHIAVRGRVVVFGFISDYKQGTEARRVRPVYDRLLAKSAEIRGFAFKHFAKSAGVHAFKMMRDIRKGRIRAVVDPTEFVGLEGVFDAIEHHHAGKNLGKVIVRIGEP